MARKPRPPSDNMDNIATVLAAGPMTWQQIQAGLERDFGWMHGAVLIGVLNAMIRRNPDRAGGWHCGLAEHLERLPSDARPSQPYLRHMSQTPTRLSRLKLPPASHQGTETSVKHS